MSAQPRILTFNFHEPYLCLMAHTGLQFDVGYYTEGKLARSWRTDYRPVPSNIHLLEPAQWQNNAQRGGYDVIIAHNEMNAADVIRFPAAGRLLVCHNRRNFLETSATADAGDPLDGFALLLSKLAECYSFVYISESKRDSYGIPGRVILPGLDVEEYGGYTGDASRIARIGNVMRERTLMFDMPLQELLCRGLPNAVIGDNPSIPGAQSAPSYEALLEIYRRWRCLLHITRQEYEDGYNLVTLEAMACGMPVVSLANRTSPIVNGENGLCSYDAREIRHGLETLLSDQDMARALGARGRETVAERFPISAFAEKWRAAIFEAAEGSRYSAGQPRIVAEPPTPLLLHYAPAASAWGRALELAGAPDFHLLSVGSPPDVEACLRADNDAFYAPPRIVLRDSESGWLLLPALPQGYASRYYLYVSAAPDAVPADLDQFKGARIFCLTGPAAAEEQILRGLRDADLVFCADSNSAAALRNVGMKNVFALEAPLAEKVQGPAAWRALLDRMLDAAADIADERASGGPAHSPKSRHYYEQPRRELMPYVPMTARSLLDVGCGAGAFASELKQTRGLERACGIEVMPDAYARAREVLDEVMLGDIERMELPFPDACFDCITCADVLEHLTDPSAALNKLSRCLAPHGIIVISIPNINYHEILTMLSHGMWTYMEAGIMDETHLRFFTAASLPDLVRNAGLEPALIAPLSMYNREKLTPEPDGTLNLGRLRLAALEESDWERLLTYQYLVVACKPGADLLAPARAALEAGRLDAAYASAGQAVGVAEWERHFLMGRAAARAGALEKAEQHYRKSLEEQFAPETAGEYGILLVGLRRAQEALPLLQRCVDARPDQDRAIGALGLAMMETGAHAEAFPLLEAALCANRKNLSLIRPFIQCGQHLGRLGDCIALVGEYVAHYSDHVDLMCDYAEILLATGRSADARECLEMAALVQPKHMRVAALMKASAGEDA